MMRKTARQLQIEVNGLMAAVDKGEPVPFLLGRLTTIIALSQAGMAGAALNPFSFLQQHKDQADGRTSEEEKSNQRKHG
jgi:hypothetical protein